MQSKKKPNIFLYTILMTIVFFLITEGLVWGYGSDLFLNAIYNYPNADLVIHEAILAFLVLIVMLIFKNSYVFTQEKERFSKGLFYGLFYIIFSIILILIGILNGIKADLGIVNLIVGCLLIGVAEEFLCRGWLLNEFLERYGDTKKGIWYSIIVSGLIFGVMHLGNIWQMGQAIPFTIEQILGAAGTGIVFGVIYYKTKNIWSVVVLHGLWDFAIFLTGNGPVKETIEVISSISVVGIIIAIIMAGVELLNIIPYIKNIDIKPKKSSVIIFSIVATMLYFILNGISLVTTVKDGETYKFNNISIKNYSTTSDNYENYFIKYTKIIDPKLELNSSVETIPSGMENVTESEEYYSFRLSKNDKNNLVFANLNTHDSIELECESLYDYIIMEGEDYYILAYIDYINSANPFLKYIYINKTELANDHNFMNNIKNGIKKYLLKSKDSELLIIHDQENNVSYLGAHDVDSGYYLLVSEDKMSILNRDSK